MSNGPSGVGFPAVPFSPDWTPIYAKQFHAQVMSLLAGKTNNVGTVTLAAGATTTVVADSRVSGESVILLMPKTANAAAALAGTYVSATTKFSFTLTHANAGTTDREFAYAVIG